MKNENVFGRNVLELLENENMTQHSLASHIGIKDGSLSRYINGQREPKLSVVKAIAKYFGVSVDWLVFHEGVGE
jgi:transcriptional regulator with XRE-family HTH domain